MASYSVKKRGNSWTAVFDLPPEPATGKRRQKRITRRTKKAAEEEARRIIHEAETRGYTDGGRTLVRDFLAQWLEDYGNGAWEKTTYRRSAGIVNNHLVPALGNLPLERVGAADLTRLYRQKLDDGLSSRSVRYIHAIAKQAFSHAVKWGILRFNPADAADPPKLQKSDIEAWGECEIRQFLEAAHGSRYYAAFALTLLTGLRRGELLGLRWQDIDLDRGELTVRQALKDDNGKLYFGAPKRHRSRRPVALSNDAVSLLRSHRHDQLRERLQAGPAWEDQHLVFATERGGPIQPSNFARSFRAIVDRAGVKYIPPHGMRHTHATLLLTIGTHTKVVSERLGHASSAFTMDVYSHVLPDMQRKAVDDLGLLIQLPKA